MQPGEYQAGSIPNVVSFGFDRIPPPSTAYIQRDDLLVLTGTTQVSGGDVLTLTARLLVPIAQRPGQPSYTPPPPPSPAGATQTAGTAGAQAAQSAGKMHGFGAGPGHIQVIQRVLRLPVASTIYTDTLALSEGYLLSVAVTSQNATLFGQTYVGVYVGRGAPGGATPVPAQLLVADYPTSIIPVGWPSVPLRETSVAQGVLVVTPLSLPLAGHDWTYTSPTGTRTRVHAVGAGLITSVAVANRFVRFQVLTAGAQLVADMPFGIAQAASLTYRYTAALGEVLVNDTANSLCACRPMPAVDLPAGWQLQSKTVNITAADQWGGIYLALEQWVQ
jgi:hypothetical protein